MNVRTKVAKNYHGKWFAESYVDMGTFDVAEGGKRVLRISTTKGSSGPMYTSASAMTEKPDGCTVCMIFQEYRKILIKADPKTRCTEKSVRSQHDEALTQIDALLIEALAHDKENGK